MVVTESTILPLSQHLTLVLLFLQQLVADISSDIVLTRDGLMTTIDALDLAVKLGGISVKTLCGLLVTIYLLYRLRWALYHSHGLVLPPWFAAAAMSLSSMCVILNSIRLRWSFERGMARRRHGSRITPR